MKLVKTTNIPVETKRRFIIRQNLRSETILCEPCAKPMIAAQTAARFFAVSSRTIYRLVETETIHFTETETNELYVCPASTKDALENLSGEQTEICPTG